MQSLNQNRLVKLLPILLLGSLVLNTPAVHSMDRGSSRATWAVTIASLATICWMGYKYWTSLPAARPQLTDQSIEALKQQGYKVYDMAEPLTVKQLDQPGLSVPTGPVSTEPIEQVLQDFKREFSASAQPAPNTTTSAFKPVPGLATPKSTPTELDSLFQQAVLSNNTFGVLNSLECDPAGLARRVNLQFDQKRTALFWAIDHKNVPLVRALVEMGLNTQSEDCYGMTATIYALIKAQTDASFAPVAVELIKVRLELGLQLTEIVAKGLIEQYGLASYVVTNDADLAVRLSVVVV